MFKVFAFLKRNAALLTHDEYRAGHVGYHCGQSRRLRNIRGYLVNVWSNTPFRERTGPALYEQLTIAEPAGFLDWWDGFPEVYFDDQASWVDALTVEPNRATATGLTVDPDWSLADGPFLFDPVPGSPGEFKPCHILMHEHVILPVERRERRTFKLVQFFRNAARDGKPFEPKVLNDYAPVLAELQGCNGCIVNFRDADQAAAMRGFYREGSWGHSSEGIAHRAAFCELWDGAVEYHFDDARAFANARERHHDRLKALESTLFSSTWYVEVDENLVVMPNRDPAPDFYYR